MKTISLLSQVARSACESIMCLYSQASDALEFKEDKSPLTAADRASNSLICDGLTGYFPEVPILSEEAEWLPGDASCFWAVDPLDGTKEYLSRNGEFSVNIALILDGVPRLGLVAAPATGEIWAGIYSPHGENWAAKSGVDSQNFDDPRAWESIRAGIAPHPDGDPIRMVGSRSHANTAYPSWLHRIVDGISVRELGSALKFAAIAQADADLYIRMNPTGYWDTAAGQALLCAAGGAVIDLWSNQPVRYHEPKRPLNESFIAYSPSFLKYIHSNDRL